MIPEKRDKMCGIAGIKYHNHQKENGARAKKSIDLKVSQAKEIFFITTNVICIVLSTSIFYY